MVRKRSKGAKRYFDSEDELETESEYEDDPEYKPETRKYSLRQRKKATFNSDDYEYEEDLLDTHIKKVKSDDEDFEVKDAKTLIVSNKEKEDDKISNESKSISEPTSIPTVQDELVDFEDMIRADIVMNKNRIDYDNVIQKSEIKIQQSDSEAIGTNKSKQKQAITKPKGRRGRKPKNKNNEVVVDEPLFLAPQIQENENDEDYHPYKPKRTRKPKARPAGEIDSSILDDIDDYEFEDQNDVDYNPDDDLEFHGLSGLSNFILDKQVSVDVDNEENIQKISASANKPTSLDQSSKYKAQDTGISTSAVGEVKQNSSTSPSVAEVDTSTRAPDISSTQASDDANNQDEDDGVPRQLNEKSGNFEKVSSTSCESVIKVNETVTNNSNLCINGSIKHIENPEVNIVDCKDEIESEDDDLILIEERREIIVLDD